MNEKFKRLPQLMLTAIETLQELHNTPDSLAMPAVLGIANLAAMPHYRVESVLFGQIPISMFILCMLPTGMRKSTNYKELEVGISRFEDIREDLLKNDSLRFQLQEKVFKREQAKYIKDMEDNGSFSALTVPTPPVPIETCEYRIGTATLNGLLDQLKSQPFAGLFSSEAGEFFTGHAFQGGRDDKRGDNMGTMLTKMWDGQVLHKLTGQDRAKLKNRAVNMMFFLQEEMVRDVLNNPKFNAQGFINRILITQGTYSDPLDIDMSDAGQQRILAIRKKLDPFHDRIFQVISQHIPQREGHPFETAPRVLNMTTDARQRATDYYNRNKSRGREDLRHWNGFAERLLEHMLRIAGTLAAFEFKREIDADSIDAAMDLMEYFIDQRVALEMGVQSMDQVRVDRCRKLGEWISTNQFSGSKNDLRRRIRWFAALSEPERQSTLEDLVNSGEIFVRAETAPSGRLRVTYSATEGDTVHTGVDKVSTPDSSIESTT